MLTIVYHEGRERLPSMVEMSESEVVVVLVYREVIALTVVVSADVAWVRVRRKVTGYSRLLPPAVDDGGDSVVENVADGE